MESTDTIKYRSELKYLCPDAQLTELEARLRPLMSADIHGDENNCYAVNSLYFDNYINSCYVDNDIGTGIRYKYRVRYYGDNTEHLTLERKEKYYGLGHKSAAAITESEFKMMCARYGMSLFWENDNELLRQFAIDKATRLFSPKVIISYERKAYTLYGGQIRITFDRNISASADVGRFLTRDFALTPIQPVGTNLLEVKYDEFLPDYIKRALDVSGLVQTAFSKYVTGRNAVLN
jgi:hypothetical protein